MKGEDVNSLQPKELIAIEEALTNGQTSLRDKMVMQGVKDSELASVSYLFCGILLSVSDVGVVSLLQMDHWKMHRRNVWALNLPLRFAFPSVHHGVF